jgi:uncharacterized protein
MIRKLRILSLLFALFSLALLQASSSISGEYEAMKGVSSAKAVFDFRIGDPALAMGHLNLIHSMASDPAMVIDGKKPELVLVLIGPSVNLVSTGKKVDAGDQDAIARKISAMDADGVEFVVCMASANALGIPEASILPQIRKVQNGWISIVGYQHNGYALIADF